MEENMVYIKKTQENYRQEDITKMKEIFKHLLNELYHQPLENPLEIKRKLETMIGCVDIWMGL